MSISVIYFKGLMDVKDIGLSTALKSVKVIRNVDRKNQLQVTWSVSHNYF